MTIMGIKYGTDGTQIRGSGTSGLSIPIILLEAGRWRSRAQMRLQQTFLYDDGTYIGTVSNNTAYDFAGRFCPGQRRPD